MVGSARIDCKLAPSNDLVEVCVMAKNNFMAAAFYRVNDTVRCWIDPVSFLYGSLKGSIRL